MRRMVLAASAALALAACSQAGEESIEADEVVAAASPTHEEGVGKLATAAATDGPDPRRVACVSDEQELFSCTAGSKRIAVCGVTNAQGQKTAQYRFGSEDEAEIVLDGGRFASVPYSGGGEAQIAFSNGDTRYIVYSRTVRTGFGPEGNQPEFTDGVMVVSNGETIADRQCTARVESIDVMAGEAYGGVANELFHYAE